MTSSVYFMRYLLGFVKGNNKRLLQNYAIYTIFHVAKTCPPVLSGVALSGLAISIGATWSRDASPHNFDVSPCQVSCFQSPRDRRS